MEHIRLGNAGLKVSRLALGCMSYGDPTTPNAHPWALTEAEATALLPAGGRARRHVLGHRERLPTRHVRRDRRTRDHPLLQPRRDRARDQGPGQDARRPRRRGPVAQGDSRTGRRVPERLGTDYIDLYQIHRFDPDARSRRRWRRCTTHQGGQGALHRRVLDVRVAVRKAPARRGSRWWTRSCPCRTSTTCCAGTTNES